MQRRGQVRDRGYVVGGAERDWGDMGGRLGHVRDRGRLGNDMWRGGVSYGRNAGWGGGE